MILVLACALSVALASPAFAASYYIVQNTRTDECKVVRKKPKRNTLVLVGDGTARLLRCDAAAPASRPRRTRDGSDQTDRENGARPPQRRKAKRRRRDDRSLSTLHRLARQCAARAAASMDAVTRARFEQGEQERAARAREAGA